MGEKWEFQVGVVGALFLSVASSVSIVICNKALMSNLGFHFATTLTSWHLMVTYCTLHLAQRLKFFETKSVDMKTVVMFGILNGVSIGLLNLSLGFNSIGFYQMTKLAIIPFTVLLETIFLNKHFSRKIKFSLFILLVGVGIASITDLQLNFVGTVLSALAIITTCVGIHRVIMPDRGVSELQHIPGDRKDITSNIPSTRTSEDMLSTWIKDKENLPLSTVKNVGVQDNEGHEKVKAAKDSLV
uniref:Sugar phosphate transporter domain-containing protein n=1 Tax=Chenopodium quinoa TaxID=63459 RepID=A0A803M3I3_CHEQI